MSTQILVLSPEGQSGTIPAENLEAAKQRGFKQAVRVTSPEGTGGTIPLESAAAAIKRGFTVGQPTPQFNKEVGNAPSPLEELRPGVADMVLGPAATAGKLIVAGAKKAQEGARAARDLITQQASSMNPGDMSGIHIPSLPRGGGSLTPTPAVNIPAADVQSAYQNVVAPLGKAGASTLEGQYDPKTLATMGAMGPLKALGPLGRIASTAAGAYYTSKMVPQAGQQIGEGLAQAEQGNTPAAVENLAGGAMTAGMAADMARGTAAETPRAAQDTAALVRQAPDLVRAGANALPTAITSRVVPDFLKTQEMAAVKGQRVQSKRAANLSSAMETGGKADKGTMAFEDIGQPIVNDFRATAAEQGKTGKDFSGRNGYKAAQEVTSAVRQKYDDAYNNLVEPIKNEPATDTAKQAAFDVVGKMLSDASLMDEIQRGDPNARNVQQLRNVAGAISSARTIGDMDAMRVTLNRLAQKYEAKSSAGQYGSPLAQESLSEAANSIRNALYPAIARAHGGMTVNGESIGIPEEQIRQMQRNHGAAIQADNLMGQSARELSSVASSETAKPAPWRVAARFGYRGTMGSKSHAAAGVLEKLLGGSDLDLFNTRMKRVVKGAQPNEGTQFPKPPITPEYVGGKVEPNMSAQPGFLKIGAGPQTVIPNDPRFTPPALPSGSAPELPPGPPGLAPQLPPGMRRIPSRELPVGQDQQALPAGPTGILPQLPWGPRNVAARTLPAPNKFAMPASSLENAPQGDLSLRPERKPPSETQAVAASGEGVGAQGKVEKAGGQTSVAAITRKLLPGVTDEQLAADQENNRKQAEILQSEAMSPKKGAGDKGAQPKQETPAAVTVYRGGQEGDPNARFFTDEKSYAENYANPAKGRTLIEQSITPKKLLDLAKPESAQTLVDAFHQAGHPEVTLERLSSGGAGAVSLPANVERILAAKGYDWMRGAESEMEGGRPTGRFYVKIDSSTPLSTAGRSQNEDVRTQSENAVAPEPGRVGEMPVADIRQAPHRFQYKLNTDAEGVGQLLKGQSRYNPELGGVISVWRDPADGNTYVINGHHRLELARRTGVDSVAVRHIVAADETKARANGALQNIAEGMGTPIDAAKFMRDAGITPERLAKEGVPMGKETAAKGVALAALEPGLFNRVVQGDIPVERAAIIGEATSDPAEQRAIAQLVEKRERGGKRINNDTLRELVRFVKGSGQQTESTASLFGEETISKSLAIEKADVSAYIKQQLAGDKKIFGFVSKGNRPGELERGNNIIDAKTSKQLSEDAGQGAELYDKLSTRTGPISDILDAAASRIAAGENANAVKQKAYDAIREEVSQALRPGDNAGLSGREGGAQRKFSVGTGPANQGYRQASRSGELGWGSGITTDQLREWASGGKIKVEDGGYQNTLFGEPEKMYRVSHGGERALVSDTQLRSVAPGSLHEQTNLLFGQSGDSVTPAFLPKKKGSNLPAIIGVGAGLSAIAALMSNTTSASASTTPPKSTPEKDKAALTVLKSKPDLAPETKRQIRAMESPTPATSEGMQRVYQQSADEDRKHVVIDASTQTGYVVFQHHVTQSFPISTGKYGIGSGKGQTPGGLMEIADIRGRGLPLGTVMKGGQPMYENGKLRIAPTQEKASDVEPLMTSRYIYIRGLDPENKYVLDSGVRMHGTNKEGNLGTPDSHGCIRIPNALMAELADTILQPGSKVLVLGRPPSTSGTEYASARPAFLNAGGK